MNAWIPPALSELLGTSLDALDESAVKRLIGFAENDHLEFKSIFPKASDKGRRDFAQDVTQFANAAGGLIIFGMQELAGVAERIVPIEADASRPEPVLWIDQTLAGLVVPHLPIGRRSIEVDGGEVYVVSVPPSIASPHGVKVNDALRYVTRSGSQLRPLAEHEVAGRYRARFDRLSDSHQLAVALHEQARTSLPLDPPTESEASMWLVVSAVPDHPGSIGMRRGLATEWESQVFEHLFDFPSFGRSEHLRLSPRYQSMSLESQYQRPSSIVGQLNLDGSGAISQALRMHAIGPGGHDLFGGSQSLVTELTGTVRGDYVVADLVNTVNVLGRHALRCGAHGGLNVTASLQMARADVGRLALVTADRMLGHQLAHGSITAPNPTEPISRSLVLDAIALTPASLLDSSRLLASDLFSHFALPEAPQFNEVGELQAGHFDQHLKQPIANWLSSNIGPQGSEVAEG